MKNHKFRNMIAVIISLIIIVFIYWGGIMLSPGSYGYAQEYDFDVTKRELIKTVEDLKAKFPEYRPPAYLADKYDDYNDFHIYFYFKSEDEIVHFFVQLDPVNDRKSCIFFVGVSPGTTLGHWTEINRDFNRSDNLAVKKKFRERILDKLDLEYTKAGNNNMIFWK